MEFKGTKGKWSIRETFDPNYDQPVLSIDSLETFTDDIITVWSGQDLGDKINEVTRANALLISKAPEMLEMLKEANKLIEWYMENTKPDNDNYTDFFNLGMNARTEIEQLINEATNV